MDAFLDVEDRACFVQSKRYSKRSGHSGLIASVDRDEYNRGCRVENHHGGPIGLVDAAG